MGEIWDAVEHALRLIFTFDTTLVSISLRSLYVTLSAVVIATIIAIPLAGFLVMHVFIGRGFVIAFLNALMGLPPVAVGLVVYLLLSREGPFGVLGLLFTPAAMIIAQVFIITPLIASVAFEAFHRQKTRLGELFISLNVGKILQIKTLSREARHEIVLSILVGFGRGIGEVGAIMIVGGNIDNSTRVLTTAIATETSRGDIRLALSLGFVLIFISLTVNVFAHIITKQNKVRK